MKSPLVCFLAALLLVGCFTSCSEVESKYKRFEEISAKMVEEARAKSQDIHDEVAPKKSLKFLAASNGEYPSDVHLLTHAATKSRLRRLLQGRYDEMKDEIWQVESPMEVKDGLLFAEAMQAHSGGNPSARIVADLKKNLLTVGIYNNGKAAIYAEDPAEVPAKMQAWANDKSEVEDPTELATQPVVEEPHIVWARPKEVNQVYMCRYCGAQVTKIGSPRSGRCSVHDGDHRWESLGSAGSTSFSCRYCGGMVSLAQNPRSARCSAHDSDHRWEQL